MSCKKIQYFLVSDSFKKILRNSNHFPHLIRINWAEVIINPRPITDIQTSNICDSAFYSDEVRLQVLSHSHNIVDLKLCSHFTPFSIGHSGKIVALGSQR